MRKKLFFLFIILTTCCFSQSPDTVFYRLRAMQEDLMTYADSLSEKEIELNDEMLKEKVFTIFDSIFTGQTLKNLKADVDSGLSAGWVLANTDCFDWAFPVKYLENARTTYYLIVSRDSASAKAVYSIIGGDNDGGTEVRHSTKSFLISRYVLQLVKTRDKWRISQIKNLDDLDVAQTQ
jgi:hypothetical protein